MEISEILKLAFIALRANKSRSFLTTLGIIIGVASVILLISIGTGLQVFITSQFESLGSNTIYVLPGKVDLKASSGFAAAVLNVSKFDLTDIDRLEKSEGAIKRVTPAMAGTGTISYKGETITVEVAGVWPIYFNITNFHISQGRLFNKNDEDKSSKVAVFGSKPVNDLFKKENPIGKIITINDIQYKLIGVLESKGGGGLGANIDNHVFIPYSTSTRLYNKTNPYAIYVEALSQQKVSEAIKQTERILLKRLKKDDFTILEQKELLSTINQFLGVITLALGGIASISLLVGGIGIMNIMLVSVTERIREIGLRKAMGATENIILLQFLIEAISLSLIGGIIGIILGFLGSVVLGSFIKTAVSWWSVLLAFFVSSAVGVIFGVFPAQRAAKLNPIDALRYE